MKNNAPQKHVAKPAVLADKMNSKGKLSIAEIVTKARENNFRIIYKKEVEPLNEIAYKKLSSNFELITKLNDLDEKSKNLVYDMMDISADIESSFKYIEYDNYWKRACYEHFRTSDVLMHGDNWKQCYAENYIKKRIMNFDESEDLYNLINMFIVMKNYIFNLDIPYFSAHFDLSLIPKYFINLTKLELKYSPKLLDKNRKKENVFTKKITRKCKLNYS